MGSRLLYCGLCGEEVFDAWEDLPDEPSGSVAAGYVAYKVSEHFKKKHGLQKDLVTDDG